MKVLVADDDKDIQEFLSYNLKKANYSVIIGDWGLVPFLTTYDLKGNKIDSTGFYDKSGQDMGYEAIEHLTFNADRTITVIDTVKLWDFNEDETDIIEGSMKMTTGKIEYRTLDNGQIEKK